MGAGGGRGGWGSRWLSPPTACRNRFKAFEKEKGDQRRTGCRSVLPNRIQDGLKISPVTTSALNLPRRVVQLQLAVIVLRSERLRVSQVIRIFRGLFSLAVVLFYLQSELMRHQQLHTQLFGAWCKRFGTFFILSSADSSH